MAYVITLVHGTYARNAPWTQPGSMLLQKLEEYIPNSSPNPFLWDGKNSVESRRRAADDLRTELKRLFENYENAKHLIIAHSHGGNIAQYALKDPDVRSKIYGVVCLSTRFSLSDRET